jgi:hypothetical protein
MKTVYRMLCAVVASLAIGVAFGTVDAAGGSSDMYVHNHTGHEAVVYHFKDDKVHLDSTGGTQLGRLKDGESLTVHLKNCTFSIVLIAGEDVWHREFRNCDSTDVSFNEDTGHVKQPPK